MGSFLNVVIYRLHSKEGMVFSSSKCPHCKRRLGVADLVPLFSFLFLSGKCRYCQKEISWQYPVVEFVTGLLFVIIFYFKGGIELFLSFDLILFLNILFLLIVSSFLILIFVYDLKHYLILDRVLLPAYLVTLLALLLTDTSQIVFHLLGSFIFGFSLFLIYYISKGEWIGGGDVKLAFLLGLMIGFPEIMVTFFLAFVGGGLVACVLMLLGKKKLHDKLPLGTFLCLAAFLSFFIGTGMIEWYLGLLGLE